MSLAASRNMQDSSGISLAISFHDFLVTFSDIHWHRLKTWHCFTWRSSSNCWLGRSFCHGTLLDLHCLNVMGKRGFAMNNDLVVSTPLKNTSQFQSFPQVCVKINNVWNHHLDNHFWKWNLVWVGHFAGKQSDTVTEKCATDSTKCDKI